MTRLVPSSTIGIIGGGQLARMMAQEGRRMGYRVRILDPDPECAAGQVADGAVTARLDDIDAACRLAEQCDILTLDTEHVPAPVLSALEQMRPVRPGAEVLATIQDRREQRRFLSGLSVPQPRHAFIEDAAALKSKAEQVGFPSVLKTRRFGYDGRGQVHVRILHELEQGWARLGEAPAVLEAFVDYRMEVSVLLARGLDGELAFFPVAENVHRTGILHTTRVPARLNETVAALARSLAARIANGLAYVGVLAIEFFVTPHGRLLVNEVAPRPHNSGHFTLGGCTISQFEQHLRAISGMPLGDPSLLRPCVMLNLMGDLWNAGEPDWTTVFAHPSASLHLYGKREARPGRKMAHVLFTDREPGSAARDAESVFEDLSRASRSPASLHEPRNVPQPMGDEA